jgi:MoxR-like ATPase
VEIADIHAVIHDVFRHRLVESEHTKLNGTTIDDVINIVLERVKMPEGMEPDEREMILNRAKQ